MSSCERPGCPKEAVGSIQGWLLCLMHGDQFIDSGNNNNKTDKLEARLKEAIEVIEYLTNGTYYKSERARDFLSEHKKGGE